jgi:signal transduction histidine kinase
MFSSLRARLWLSYALMIVTALSIVAFVLFIYLLRNPFLYRQTLVRLRAIEIVVSARQEEQSGQLLLSTLDKAARTFNVRLVQFSQDGQVLADTRAGDAPELPLPKRNLFSPAIPIARDGNGQRWLYTLHQLPDTTWLMVAVPRPRLSVLNIFTDELLPLFLRGGVLALLLSLLVAFLFARWLANPLQQVIAAARAQPSDTIRTVEVRGPQEVQELTRAFNSMLTRLHSSQKSQREFVANVSHELKTPLTSIQGFAQAIVDDTAHTPDARRQAAEIIYDEAGRMHRMVLALLDLARLEAGTADLNMAPLDVAGLLKSIAEKFIPQASKEGISIIIDQAPDLPPIIGDGDRLAQVFTNLVDNALKFSPHAGTVALRAWPGKGEICLSVSDQGSGISSEDLPHIFERFFQADRSRQGGCKHGTGLGLAIVQEIVLAHGGRISVRSQPGQGTTFIVQLPLAPSAITTRVNRRN